MVAVVHLAKDLLAFYRHFRACFKSRTHDGGCHALRYLRGQVIMEDQRNFANIERRVKPGSDGQKLQHFMSDSPWSSRAVYAVTLLARAKKRFAVIDLARRRKTRWRRVRVRSVERGWLVADLPVERIWTPNQADELEALWLGIRRDLDGRLSSTLLNDPLDTPPEVLIEASCQRHFVECAFEDAKSELGWDDLCAQKYLAWEHHTALTAAALCFIAGVKLEWRQKYQRDPQLNKVFELEVLPALSTANVRELLQAILPLPRLGARQARDLVVKHFIGRSRSTRSRLKKQSENSS